MVLVGADGSRQTYKLVMQTVVNGPLQDAQLVLWDGTSFGVPPDRLPSTVAVQATSVRFGACPPAGSTAADVVTKFGQKSFVRTFLGTPSGTPPVKIAGASGVHISWSLGGATGYQPFIDGTYDTAMKACLAGLDPTYFYVEALHELDNKVNGGTTTLAIGTAVKNHFYDLVQAANPALRVVNTLTGYAFSDNNTKYTSGATDLNYGSIKAHIIGLDLDGIHSFPYPNLDTRAKNAQKFIRDHAAYGYTDWAVPEWGTTTTQPQDQPDLLIMANDWITKYGNAWKAEAKPPVWVTWYDYGSNPEDAGSTATDLLTVPAPINALKALVAGYSPPTSTPPTANFTGSPTSGPVSGTLLFEDDFVGAAGAAPDPAKWAEWSTATYNGSAAYGNIKPGMRATLDGSGHLVIPATPTAGTSISTAGKFDFVYGTVSIWAMAPTTPGYWPGLWTLNNTPDGDPDLPVVGEIDIHESYTGLANYYHRATHNWSGATTWSAAADPSAGLGHVFGEWHKYSARVAPGEIRFFFDDVEQGPPALKSEGAGKPYAFGPDIMNGNWIILTLAIGGAGGQQDGMAVSPAQLLIDRVEVRAL